MRRPPDKQDPPDEQGPPEGQGPAESNSTGADPPRRALVERRSATEALVDGQACLAFAGCDYLGLSQHAEVRAAAVRALERYGTSVGASRTTSGTLPLHLELEESLAEFLGTESALVVEDGYIADLAVARGLAEGAAAVLVDEDAHPSLLDAARLSGLDVHLYQGDELIRAHALLDRHQARAVLVLTDGVFTQQGRLAQSNELLRLLPRLGTLVIDDSHALGVLSQRGRGSLEVHALSDPRIVVTASLAKALGAAGGVIAGSAERIERIRRRSAPYIATTGLAPAATGAALAALGVLEREPGRVERLTANTGSLHRAARRLGWTPRGTFLPVLRLGVVADEEQAAGLAPGATIEALARALRVAGIYAPVSSYPGAAGAQLRLTVTSEHTGEDLARLEAALGEHAVPLVHAT